MKLLGPKATKFDETRLLLVEANLAVDFINYCVDYVQTFPTKAPERAKMLREVRKIVNGLCNAIEAEAR